MIARPTAPLWRSFWLAIAALGACALLDAQVGRASDGGLVGTRAGLPLVRVPGGTYKPLYSGAGNAAKVAVAPFLLMTRPVTNAEFLEFVRAHPAYQRDGIARVFADASYLSHWAGSLALGADTLASQPVTRVSWFAAKAFCTSRGLRLPLEAEWELAAAASETRRDATSDPAFVRRLLAWYATPNRSLPEVPHGKPNLYGIYDLHGVVWEWVLDFNNAYAVSDSREQGDTIDDRFCGGGSVLASDTANYAAFMRVALRSSLQADYTTANLGFRCAGDPKESRP